MEIPQSKAYEIVGQQQVEIVVLREHVRLLQDQNAALRAAAQEKPDGTQTPSTEAETQESTEAARARGRIVVP